MGILKFDNFFSELNEAVSPLILDVVVGEDGTIYNGEEGTTLVKGRVDKKSNGEIKRILGTDNKLYPMGIDKNGRVQALFPDVENRALDSEEGNPIEIPVAIQKKYKVPPYYYTGLEYDYHNLVPISPTGWVNVKIDMEIVKRVRRYARPLGTNNKGHQSFIDKLLEFARLSSGTRTQGAIKRLKRGSIQKEMGCILLLHYINEIKDFFNPSSGGFLFESFIAGLIPNARIKEDNTKVDIRTTNGDRYQSKFIDGRTSNVEVTMDNDSNVSPYLEYYMIALKYADRIDIFIIDGGELGRRIDNGTIGSIVTPNNNFSMSNVRSNANVEGENFISMFKIDLTDIDGRINNLGESLKSNLNSLYEDISSLQYNVETIVTGVDKKGKVVRDQGEFDGYYGDAQENIKSLAVNLDKLVVDINK